MAEVEYGGLRTQTVLVRLVRPVVLSLAGVVAWAAALTMATSVRLSVANSDMPWRSLVGIVLVAAITQILADAVARTTLGGYKIGSVDEVGAVVRSWAVTSVMVALSNYFVFERPVPSLALILAAAFAMVIMLGVRFGWRVWRDHGRRPVFDGTRQRVLVFGAGEGGEQIVRSMVRDPDSAYVPVGLLDDDLTKSRRQFHGVKVLGTRGDLVEIAARTRADVLLIAVPSASTTMIQELDELAQSSGLSVMVLPSTTELVGMLTTADIRELSEADLLGRAEVSVDMGSIRGYIDGKRVLVTGAGGSIGSELCRQLAQLSCNLVMLDRDESGLHQTQLMIEGRALLDSRSLVVADIRDRDRIFEVFEEHRPEVVFHAAALKHLTLLEQYPDEGWKTNVEGSRNVLDAADAFGVSTYVNVSTDKAADPSSVLGRTKREAELLTAAKAGMANGVFASVRFGNVLGSRGSVLPIFRHQIAKGGPVTVTHPDVTRYFMTIPEAVRLVLQAGAIGRPGEVMILDMGEPVKIADLARQMIRHFGSDAEIVYTGLRPGEKLHEILVSDDEIVEVREHPRVLHAINPKVWPEAVASTTEPAASNTAEADGSTDDPRPTVAPD